METAKRSTASDYLPQETAVFYEEQPFAQGTRMMAFRGKNGLRKKVIRVPFETEEELKRKSGEDPDDRRISQSTRRDIDNQQILADYLNGHVVTVIPSPAPDRKGDIRTYGLQPYVEHTREDLRHWSADFKEIRDEMRSFVASLLHLIHEVKLIPDLLGHHNVVVAKVGGGRRMVKLIDVNNVRPVLTREEYSSSSDDELKEAFNDMFGYRKTRKDLLALLHPDYLDSKGMAMGDESLEMLHAWLLRLDMKEDAQDPIFQVAEGQRGIILNWVKSERDAF